MSVIVGRQLPKVAAPKPCPTCYRPMVEVGKTWVCEKHGEPVKP